VPTASPLNSLLTAYGLLFTAYRSPLPPLTVYCSPLTVHRFPAYPASHRLRLTVYGLPFTASPLTAYGLPFTAYRSPLPPLTLLLTAYGLLFTAYRSPLPPLTAYGSLFTTYRSPHPAYRASPLTVHCSPLTVPRFPRSPLTVYCSPLTVHRFPAYPASHRLRLTVYCLPLTVYDSAPLNPLKQLVQIFSDQRIKNLSQLPIRGDSRENLSFLTAYGLRFTIHKPLPLPQLQN